jgi:hypothetical protein
MFDVVKVREIAQELASKVEYTSYLYNEPPKVSQIDSSDGEVIQFREVGSLSHKYLLTATEDDIRRRLSLYLTDLLCRVQNTFSGCNEVEHLGPTMFGADAVYDAKEIAISVLFYSYSAGIKVVRQRVTEEKV